VSLDSFGSTLDPEVSFARPVRDIDIKYDKLLQTYLANYLSKRSGALKHFLDYEKKVWINVFWVRGFGPIC